MPNQPITISGNLTEEPFLRRTINGVFVSKLRVASDRRAPSPDKPDEWMSFDALYVDVEVWGDLAYNCRASLTKGSPVLAHGFLVTDTWMDKETNQQRSRIVIKARSVALDLSRFAAKPWKSVGLGVRREDDQSQSHGVVVDQLIDDDRWPGVDSGDSQASNEADSSPKEGLVGAGAA